MLRNQLILKIDKEIIYLTFPVPQGMQKADEKFLSQKYSTDK